MTTSTTPKPTQTKKTAKTSKKKRRCKHIEDAQRKHTQKKNKTEEATTTASKSQQVVNDVSHVLRYISTWKHRDSGSKWKFSKNKQSWILRHMYNVSLVNKSLFCLIVEYLHGLKGENRKRIYNDAVKRSLRYKNWEKQDGHPEERQEDTNATTASTTCLISMRQYNNDTIWKELSDNDKRKEYKRSRRIIDIFKDDQKESLE